MRGKPGQEMAERHRAEVGDQAIGLREEKGAGALNRCATHIAESPAAFEIANVIDDDFAIIRKTNLVLRNETIRADCFPLEEVSLLGSQYDRSVHKGKVAYSFSFSFKSQSARMANLQAPREAARCINVTKKSHTFVDSRRHEFDPLDRSFLITAVLSHVLKPPAFLP